MHRCYKSEHLCYQGWASMLSEMSIVPVSINNWLILKGVLYSFWDMQLPHVTLQSPHELQFCLSLLSLVWTTYWTLCLVVRAGACEQIARSHLYTTRWSASFTTHDSSLVYKVVNILSSLGLPRFTSLLSWSFPSRSALPFAALDLAPIPLIFLPLLPSSPSFLSLFLASASSLPFTRFPSRLSLPFGVLSSLRFSPFGSLLSCARSHCVWMKQISIVWKRATRKRNAKAVMSTREM